MHNFLLTPLPFHFPPDLHNFIIFPPHSFLFSSSSTIFYFPSSILNSLLLLHFIISPSCPHFILHIFPSTTTSTLYRPSSEPTLKFYTRFFKHSFVNSETIYHHHHQISFVFLFLYHHHIFIVFLHHQNNRNVLVVMVEENNGNVVVAVLEEKNNRNVVVVVYSFTIHEAVLKTKKLSVGLMWS